MQDGVERLCDQGQFVESERGVMLKSSGGEAEAEAVAPPKRSGGRGRGMRKVTTFIDNDKENFDIYGGNVGLNETKSPLPLGYPRMPLQDITAVLRPLNNSDGLGIAPIVPMVEVISSLVQGLFQSDEEEPSTGMRKPFTRLQGLRKMGNVQTTVLSERTSKNAGRAGPSKTRKKQVVKFALNDEIKTIIQTGDTVQMKEQTTNLTVNLSSSVHLTEQTLEGQKIEQVQSAAKEAPVKIGGEETIASDSAGSVAAVNKDSGAKPMEFVKETVTEQEQEERGTKPMELTTETGTEQEEHGTKPVEATKETVKEQEEHGTKPMEVTKETVKEQEERRTKPMETGTEQEEQKAAPEKPKESSIPSSSSTRNKYSQDPKRRKPLSTRSKVSSFR